ncbi:MAG: hypothetical protein WC714_20140 [Candidatus Obscuribacterales bacterium]|jgi:hypothetical protein
MYNPFLFPMIFFNFQLELTQRLLLASVASARPPRAQLSLVAANNWRLPQRSRAHLTLVT